MRCYDITNENEMFYFILPHPAHVRTKRQAAALAGSFR